MPDNINLAGPSDKIPDGKLLFPKMGFYVRATLDAHQPPPKLIMASVEIPGLDLINLGAIGPDDIRRAFDDAVAKGSPLFGVLFKGVLAPISILESGGMAKLHIVIDGEDQICGILNFSVLP